MEDKEMSLIGGDQGYMVIWTWDMILDWILEQKKMQVEKWQNLNNVI